MCLPSLVRYFERIEMSIVIFDLNALYTCCFLILNILRILTPDTISYFKTSKNDSAKRNLSPTKKSFSKYLFSGLWRINKFKDRANFMELKEEYVE